MRYKNKLVKVPSFFPTKEATTDSQSLSAIGAATFFEIICCFNWVITGLISVSVKGYLFEINIIINHNNKILYFQ